MSDHDKKLPAGAKRYVAKKVGKGWAVYDVARGSLPVHVIIGDKPVKVKQGMTTEVEAQEEADRMEALR